MIEKIKNWMINYDRMFNTLVISLIILAILIILRNKNYSSTLTITINIVYWLTFAVFLISSFIALKTADVNHTYNNGGHLSNWYDTMLSYNGVDWLKKVFDKLYEQKLINFDDEFVFVGPTANKGVYEKALFEHLCSKGFRNKFIISDLNLIEEHEKNSSLPCGEYIYLDGKNDANEIEQNIKKANVDKADVIFDSMGYLWHTKESFWHKKRKLISLETEILKIYNAVLKKNGLIIVDNTKSPLFQVSMRQVSHFLAHLKFGAGEISTGAYLLGVCSQKRDSELKRYIIQNFELHTFESAAKDKTMMSVLVLKKK